MTRPTALIVEDDPQLSQIFSYALRSNFEIETVMDGSQALLRLADLAPQVIVLDLHLPGASGREILHFVRGAAHLAQTRVILATADAIEAEDLKDEADIVLLKPVSPLQLQTLAVRLV